ncbi:hypothetical protein ANN_06085 [Periplaneta americana]|uniref:Paired domain-containing protein n=1 Tax=Periplaneta americana TaxID=6978 RepID=A0ABQ8TDH4_PERAM|nr:hypothetical protein ANN_06085 [Periplaneta americana]
MVDQSLYERPPEATGSLDRPPWNVVQRCWMVSAMAPEADLLGGGASLRTDRGAFGGISQSRNEHSSMTQRQIAAECHIGLATVNSIIKRYRETGSITPQKKGNCGRKRKTSPADDRLIVRISKLNPRLTIVDLTRELMATTGANIHVRTVWHRLLEVGRRARKPY